MNNRAKPVAVLLQGGRTGRSKKHLRQRLENEERLKPPADDVTPPAWLGTDGQAEWQRVVQSWKHAQMITNLDTAALAVYCDAVDKYQQATQEVQRYGVTIVSPKGTPVQNPAVLAAAKYAQIVARFGRQFGLSPVARAALATPRDDEASEDDFGKRFKVRRHVA